MGKGSLQKGLHRRSKMRSSWLPSGPKSSDKCPYQRETEGHQTEWLRGGGTRHVMMGQGLGGCPTTQGCRGRQSQGGRKDPPLEPLQATWPCSHQPQAVSTRISRVDLSGCGHSIQPPRKSCGCLLWASSSQNLSATSQICSSRFSHLATFPLSPLFLS